MCILELIIYFCYFVYFLYYCFIILSIVTLLKPRPWDDGNWNGPLCYEIVTYMLYVLNVSVYLFIVLLVAVQINLFRKK